MEAPIVVEGPGAGKAIRDAKVAVLNAMQPIKLEDTVLGQYEGYADDPTIENKDTNTPTFAVIRLRINNPRWDGVPIILKAGKALNERKAEMRIQFKDAPGSAHMFGGKEIPRNELGKSNLMASIIYRFLAERSHLYTLQSFASNQENPSTSKRMSRAQVSVPSLLSRNWKSTTIAATLQTAMM